MAWAKLATKTLTGAGNEITTDVITTPKKFNFAICHGLASSGMDMQMRVGNTTIDTGTNYARRESDNGGADGSAVNATFMLFGRGTGSTHDTFAVSYFINITAQEKLFIANGVSNGGTGAGLAPDRRESVGKWANTASQIDIVRAVDTSGNFATDANLSILGTD